MSGKECGRSDSDINHELIRCAKLAHEMTGYDRSRSVSNLVRSEDHTTDVSMRIIQAYHIGVRDAVDKFLALPQFADERGHIEEWLQYKKKQQGDR